MLSSAAPRLQRHGSEGERGKGGPGERGNDGARSRRHGDGDRELGVGDDDVFAERPLDFLFHLQLGPSASFSSFQFHQHFYNLIRALNLFIKIQENL